MDLDGSKVIVLPPFVPLLAPAVDLATERGDDRLVHWRRPRRGMIAHHLSEWFRRFPGLVRPSTRRLRSTHQVVVYALEGRDGLFRRFPDLTDDSVREVAGWARHTEVAPIARHVFRLDR